MFGAFRSLCNFFGFLWRRRSVNTKQILTRKNNSLAAALNEFQPYFVYTPAFVFRERYRETKAFYLHKNNFFRRFMVFQPLVIRL